MAKSETTTEVKPIPLEIMTTDEFVDEMDGILEGKTYAVAGTALIKIQYRLREEIKLRLDAQTGRRNADVIASELHSQFADLKERLHNAEIDNAVMRGYLDRVGEDDHATDGFFEIADGNGEVSARPKRKGHGYRSYGGSGSVGSVGYALTGDGTEPNRSTKRRVHWTSY